MSASAIVTYGAWGFVASLIGYGLSFDVRRWWHRRHARPEPAPMLVDTSGPTVEQIDRARERYEQHRAFETERMRRIRRDLDELWQDEEDPLAERAAEDALRDLGEIDKGIRAYRDWLSSLPIANPLDVMEPGS